MVERLKNGGSALIWIIVYMLFFAFSLSFLWESGNLIGLSEVNSSNLLNKATSDFIVNIAWALLFIGLVYRKNRRMADIGLTKESPKLVIGLIIIYFGMFLLNQDFSIHGFYQAYFYLFAVAFSEEIIFRGFLFNQLEKVTSMWPAIIISGAIFGFMHAILPSIVRGDTFSQFLVKSMSELGGMGILGSLFYIFLYKKSGNLWVPILIHAILDYSRVFGGA
ncbi:CPBP family intramembrane metalloprotease [Enterococcus sp. 669A]|uniref:CPBP family intramembrane metalloprotease n=1 Tax=Candidatus Enterococcus moelleringii TaxID=2815325 RepID=A0ABS3LCA0_9ENTE|nr:CPBP family intramembrane glutamic endopeptidase [Enterococcus sp. 669A]MBO1307254.1 CPBP family intramembrane metalloprotease [Enterococcus sp. 669A]